MLYVMLLLKMALRIDTLQLPHTLGWGQLALSKITYGFSS